MLVYKVNREKDIVKRAAFILHAIAAQHPFFDGNKRTAFVTAENVLGEAGYYVDAGDDEIVELMRKIAEYKHTVQTIEKWIREKVKATSAPIF